MELLVGAGQSRPCIFPFILDGVRYEECVHNKQMEEKFCATEVDGDRATSLGVCGPNCRTHEEAMSYIWKTDDRFKMTLQYDNPALLTGLQLHVKLLFGILIVGLILTTLLPAIGQIMVQSQFYMISPFNSSHDDCQVREVRAQYPPSRQDGQVRQDLGIDHEKSHKKFCSKRQNFFVRTFYK